MTLLSVLDEFKRQFDEISGEGNVLSYPYIIRTIIGGKEKDCIACFSFRPLTDKINSTRPLMYGLADIITGELLSVQPCVENETFDLSYNSKCSLVNYQIIQAENPLFTFALLLAKYETTGIVDRDLYIRYLNKVDKAVSHGFKHIYKEKLNGLD